MGHSILTVTIALVGTELLDVPDRSAPTAVQQARPTFFRPVERGLQFAELLVEHGLERRFFMVFGPSMARQQRRQPF
jgi:hypothetical protein